MAHLDETINRIRRANEQAGTAELARAADVPYTTVIDWRDRDFKPRAIEIFEKLADAAEGIVSGEGVPDGVMPPASQTEAVKPTRIDAPVSGQPAGEYQGGAV